MMKRRLFLSIILVLAGVLAIQVGFAQESVRDRIAKRQGAEKKQSLPELSVRAQNMNDSQTQDIAGAPWMREIYRTIDLNKEKNAPLYYPPYPLGDRMNLFTMIFKLMANNEITGYEYLIDGREIFSEQYKLNFKDFLDKWSIMYTEEGGKFVVDESDIPSNEVQTYYVKEAWYFDKSNSVLDIKTLAICPVMIRQDDFGAESTPYPLFWIPYENIRPYANRMPIMTSNLNNASNQTIDDYFRKHQFVGEIYKTTNMRNMALTQLYPVDSIMKKEQKKIETELKDFSKDLWVYPDSTTLKEQVAKAKEKKEYKAEQRTNETKEAKEERKQDEKIEQAQSKSNQSSSTSKQPVRSMRNRRR